jgi:hypothetical protein
MVNVATRFRKVILTVVIVGISLGVGMWWLTVAIRRARRVTILGQCQVTAPETGYKFPAPSEIARMTITTCGHFERRKFDVPGHCWDEMIRSLSPSQYDPHPCEWTVLGIMDIELKTGGNCCIDLYEVGTDSSCPDLEMIGAFSAGPNFDSRKYYRGGYTSKVKAAMERAFSEHQSREGGTR